MKIHPGRAARYLLTGVILLFATPFVAAQRCAGKLYLGLIDHGDTIRFLPDSSTIDEWGFYAGEGRAGA